MEPLPGAIQSSGTRRFLAGSPAKNTRIPERKSRPVIVTGVPPSKKPEDGDTSMSAGDSFVMTIPPLNTEESPPEAPVTFLEPTGVAESITVSSVALVGAVVESRPPKVTLSKRMSGFDTENETPSTTFTPPTRRVWELPRLIRERIQAASD